jgi:hypothetical protein
MLPAAIAGPIPFRNALLAGLLSGIAAAILGTLTLLIMQALTGDRFTELTPVSITAISLLTNLLGGIAYYLLARFTARPALFFAILALVLATLDTLMVAANPLHPGFATVATPLHYVVAFVAIILIPRLAGRPVAR